MLKILRYIFSILGVLIALYGLITSNTEVFPYMIFSLGLMLLVLGLEEFQKEHKPLGWLCVTICIFLFFVSIQPLLLS